MNLSLKELNELIYCVGTVIADQPKTYGHAERKELFDKLSSELQERINYIRDGLVPLEDYDFYKDETN